MRGILSPFFHTPCGEEFWNSVYIQQTNSEGQLTSSPAVSVRTAARCHLSQQQLIRLVLNEPFNWTNSGPERVTG